MLGRKGRAGFYKNQEGFFLFEQVVIILVHISLTYSVNTFSLRHPDKVFCECWQHRTLCASDFALSSFYEEEYETKEEQIMFTRWRQVLIHVGQR